MATYTNKSVLVALLLVGSACAFSVPHALVVTQQGTSCTIQRRQPTLLYAVTGDDEESAGGKTIKAASLSEDKPLIATNEQQENSSTDDESEDAAAVTGTINERLMAELQQAADKEKYGPKSSVGKKLGSLTGRPTKTKEEQEAALAAARDLNGVNPVVALGGGLFAFAVAAGLWYGTNQLGSFFALHPVETDVYFVQRLASVFRNLVMGLASLASGFFGVTGMGIFLLGVRVAIGVAKGELDPTPIKKKKSEELEMPNVWDLMMNKKPNRRGGRGGNDDNNLFGI